MYVKGILPGPQDKRMKISTMISISIVLALLGVLVQGQQQNPGFISIDCGAPNDYYDSSQELYFNTDANFVSTGANMQVSTQVIYQNFLQQGKNLRSFPNGTRNCYTLKPAKGKSNRYLIRASFWYGNYDGKNRAPIFNLYIDVNYWTRLSNLTSFIYEEVVYLAPRDEIQVCLVNIGLGTPFVSVIELRLLDNSTYNINSGALVTAWRYNLGGSDTYRHPQDDYDRIWEPKSFRWVNVSNSEVDLKTLNDEYDVPSEVLMTASQSKDVNESISLFFLPVDPTDVWYMYFHFAEIQKSLQRVFTIYLIDEEFTTVSPEYGKPITVPSTPLSGSEINFTIWATAQSDLPPILNAIEFFYVIDLPNLQTAYDDVNTMNDIKSTYGVVRDSWQGDPCVPRNMSWIGLNCSYDNPPRIVTLNLSSSNLTGEIASSLFNLSELTSLDLSHNRLTGQIPEFLAQLPNLKFLDLSGNNLNGPVPKALKKKQDVGTLQASFEGNPNLCLSDSCTSKHKKSIIPIVAAAAAVLFAVVMGILTIFWMNKRRPRGVTEATSTNYGIVNDAPPGVALLKKQTQFTWSEVSQMTENFRLVIGEGGFGKVYLGTLQDGTKVAAKLATKRTEQGLREFEAEVKLLMIVHHRNLLPLIGYCDEMQNNALIYEFMSNGNLRQNLSEYNTSVLTWIQRLQIAIDSAQGLEYLHNGCKPPIVHRDLKTSNILLNENMQAKIADFGLSKAFADDNVTHISTRPAGTPGYLDPEFHASGNLTKKSDVYSFGIILLELISGHPAIIRTPKGSTHLIHWVTPLIQSGDIQNMVDPRLGGQFNPGSAWKAVEIAMSCVAQTANQRPDISRVLSELKECLGIAVALPRSQKTIGNSNIRSQSFEMTSVEFEVAPRAR